MRTEFIATGIYLPDRVALRQHDSRFDPDRAVHEALELGRVARGDVLVLTAFGGGLT
jgi:hypothetical protein